MLFTRHRIDERVVGMALAVLFQQAHVAGRYRGPLGRGIDNCLQAQTGRIDGDKFNLSVNNLVWVKEGPSRFRAKNRTLMILETKEIFKNASECARHLEVSPTAISKHLRGILPTVRGLHIQYVS
jgi:hypothetical protein